jgi:hypothetical protein
MPTRREFLEQLAMAEGIDIGFDAAGLMFSVTCDHESLATVPTPLLVYSLNLNARKGERTQNIKGFSQYRFKEEVMQALRDGFARRRQRGSGNESRE